MYQKWLTERPEIKVENTDGTLRATGYCFGEDCAAAVPHGYRLTITAAGKQVKVEITEIPKTKTLAAKRRDLLSFLLHCEPDAEVTSMVDGIIAIMEA